MMRSIGWLPLTASLLVGALLALLVVNAAAGAQRPRPVRVVVKGVRDPVQAVAAPVGPADRLFVVEQRGLIVIADAGRILPRPFLDLRSVVSTGGLRGLLSVAFHPRYATTGKAYVNYVARDGALVVAEIQTVRGFGMPSSRRVLLRTPMARNPYGHFGGLLAFGPDGRLYVSLGDGGSPDAAQDPRSPLGKILRLRVGDARPVPEVVAWGLRNPWRFSFAPLSGAIVIGDVGGDAREEIDLLPQRLFGRANFGWPTFEGTLRRDSAARPLAGVVLPPLLGYHHTGKRCWSVIGGFVYRGRSFPALRGRYVYGDLCGGMWSVALAGPTAGQRRGEPLAVGGILTSIGENHNGELLLVGGDGRVVTPVRSVG